MAMTGSQPSRRRIIPLVTAGLCGLAWLGAFIATHLPPERVPHTPVSDKTLHFTGYFILAGLFCSSLASFGVRSSARIIAVISIMVTYAAVDEYTQALVRRDPSVGDWLADSMGTIAAVVVMELFFHLVSRRRTRPR